MNTLSWFLYLADILGNVQGLLIASTFISVGVTVIYTLAYLIHCDEFRVAKVMVFLAFLFAVIATIIPSKDTMYMIAASEAGEMVVKDENTQAIIKDVREVLQAQLKKLKE